MTNLPENTVLIKIGGSTLGSDDTSFSNIADLQRAGVGVIIVHGGGPEVTAWMSKQGARAEFLDGLRVTDGPGLDIATAVLAGLINKRLVAELQAAGVQAVGISGVDGGLMRGTVRLPELGFVAGDIDVAIAPLEALVGAGFVPVVSPIVTDAANPRQLLNVNADTAAGAIAVAWGVSRLVFLTDVDGILDSRGRLLHRVPLDTAEGLIGSGVVKGGMIPKLQACSDAGHAGISAHIINGTEPEALKRCLDGAAIGTAVA
jgi:acetylglutamate kinase